MAKEVPKYSEGLFMTHVGVPLFINFIRCRDRFRDHYFQRHCYKNLQDGTYSRKWIDNCLPPIPVEPKVYSDHSERIAKLKQQANAFLEADELESAKFSLERAREFAPYEPNILFDLAVIAEKMQQWMVAEGYYAMLLHHQPTHHQAIERRENILMQVDKQDTNFLLCIHSAVEEFHEVASKKSEAFKKYVRTLYIDEIYHTLALEGNTMTRDDVTRVLVDKEKVPNHTEEEHLEIYGIEEALKHLVQHPLSQNGITLDDILAIHKCVVGKVNIEIAGVLRTVDVRAGKHIAPPHSMVPKLMESFLLWLNSVKLHQYADPLELAAMAHERLVWIHPFKDGNGRTSRILMNALLEMKGGLSRVVIRLNDRSKYIDALQSAHNGNHRAFIRFIAEQEYRTLQDTIEVCRQAPQNARETPVKDDVLDAILRNDPAIYATLSNDW